MTLFHSPECRLPRNPDINRYPVASAYFLLLLIYHFSTWTLHRQNLSLHWTTGSSLKHKCGWAPGGAECSPYAPGLSPGPVLLLCLVLVMDELWGMMNRLLSGPEHILIWDSDAKRGEHHHHSALCFKIQPILYSAKPIWLLMHISIFKRSHSIIIKLLSSKRLLFPTNQTSAHFLFFVSNMKCRIFANLNIT